MKIVALIIAITTCLLFFSLAAILIIGMLIDEE